MIICYIILTLFYLTILNLIISSVLYSTEMFQIIDSDIKYFEERVTSNQRGDNYIKPYPVLNREKTHHPDIKI